MSDAHGVPLLREEADDIWEEQKKHIKCIQDLPDIPLYTVTGSSQKARVTLPVLRCAQDTTSLDFHLAK